LKTMWPFRTSKQDHDDSDEESEYSEIEYEEEYEYEIEVTDEEYEEEIKPIVGSEKKIDLTQNGSDMIEIEGLIKDETRGKNHLCNDDEGTRKIKNQGMLAEEKTAALRIEKVLQQDDEKVLLEGKCVSSSEDEYNESEYEEEDSLEEGEDDDIDFEDDTIIDYSQEIDKESSRDVEDNKEETLTSVEEKHSLLALAAEHDRVDILQSILSYSTSEERAVLIDPPQGKIGEQEIMPPPLHVAISFGSTNATACLLRMGANPAIRPAHKKFQGRTAWELAFGASIVESKIDDGSKNLGIDMAPSKRQGILYAFTAEALRCIGGDEQHRLSQLLKSGMSVNIDIGSEKNLAEWCREMNAVKCLSLFEVSNEKKLLEREKKDRSSSSVKEEEVKSPVQKLAQPPPLVKRLSSELDEADFMQNRLEELDTLAIGLSTYLDNLAEEVSVCHGLLLMGNGASALASHVRSLNDQQDFFRRDLEGRNNRWASTEKEFVQFMRHYNKTEEDLQLKDGSFFLLENNKDHSSSSKRIRRMSSNNDPIELKAQLSASENNIRKLRASIADMSEESETAMKEVERRGLTGGIKLVRKLRDEIHQLEFQVSRVKSAEALSRSKLQRLQDILALNDVKQQDKSFPQNFKDVTNNMLEDTTKQVIKQEEKVRLKRENIERSFNCTSNVATIMEKKCVEGSNDNANETPIIKGKAVEIEVSVSAAESKVNEENDATVVPLRNGLNHKSENEEEITKNSNKVTIGQSNALMKYEEVRGYMPLDLWQILLRIIGLGRVAVRQNVENLKKQSTTVMIV